MTEMRYAAKKNLRWHQHSKSRIFGSARHRARFAGSKVAENHTAKDWSTRFHDHYRGGRRDHGSAQRGAGRDMSLGLNIRCRSRSATTQTIEGDKKAHQIYNTFSPANLISVRRLTQLAFPGVRGTLDESCEALHLMWQPGKEPDHSGGFT